MNSALKEIENRLQRALNNLIILRDERAPGTIDRIRLNGKIEGIETALIYVKDEIRMLENTI